MTNENQNLNTTDCQDQYFKCTSECDPNDTKCTTECVTDLKECDVPTQEDIHTKQKEQYYESYKVDKESIISEMLVLTSLLDGKMERMETLNSQGKSSKVIRIEYDIKYNNT